ncbi:TerC family protein [Balneola vulgaris]|uniref:TerC family protein n=1 Tax=Balneola vulgaris TaxID=287535 RepID=UPI000360B033|nr:TerC family protein [Balneola vulgaris]
MADLIGVFALIIGLELVLGIDNILVITILVSRLDEKYQNKARNIGLALAMVGRLVLLALLLQLTELTNPVFMDFSIRDIILIVGGLFLLYKAVKEIHHTVELKDEEDLANNKKSTFSSVITQIVLLDIVFSVDSVITAIGLTDIVWVIITAVVLSYTLILIFAKPIGDFITENPALKILALSFLISIGITIFMEGFHKEVPKAYIYLPMGFALLVELLQMRYSKNRAQKKEAIKKL